MTQGYVIIAKNTPDTDYEQCARVLQKSLRAVGDTRSVTIITDISDEGYGPYWGDHLAYQQSPYDETFKLEADLLVTRPLDSWWKLCYNRDLHIATGTRNYRQQLSTVRHYRQYNDRWNLPDCYNGITYFKKSNLASEFFGTVKCAFENWQTIASVSDHYNGGYADTDSAYAHAAAVIGVERCTMPNDIIQWVHMKQRINNLLSENWTDELVWELVGTDFRVNTISQLYPVHYHVKSLAQQLEPLYDSYLQTLL